MSVVGVIAAAGCTGSGVLALTSDVLPFAAWPQDDDRTVAGRHMIPAAASPSGRRTASTPISFVGLVQLSRFISAVPVVSGRAADESRPSGTPGGRRRSGDRAERRRRATPSPTKWTTPAPAPTAPTPAPPASAPAVASTPAVAAAAAPPAPPAVTDAARSQSSTGTVRTDDRDDDGRGRRPGRQRYDDGARSRGSRDDGSASVGKADDDRAASSGGDGRDHRRGRERRAPATVAAPAPAPASSAAAPAPTGKDAGWRPARGERDRGRAWRSTQPAAPAPVSGATAAVPAPGSGSRLLPPPGRGDRDRGRDGGHRGR
jgi:translation initiation factor IF-2